MSEHATRVAVVQSARALFRAGLTHGRTGNVSQRIAPGFLITPTGASLETVSEEELSTVDLEGSHVAGPPASKEAFLHAAMYQARPAAAAVIHTHSSYAAALSCLELDPHDALPPLTAYYAMRVRRLPLLPYYPPGDATLGPIARVAARESEALLLSNHGPIVAGPDLVSALDVLQEIEQTAKIYLLSMGHPTKPLSPEQRASLNPGTSS